MGLPVRGLCKRRGVPVLFAVFPAPGTAEARFTGPVREQAL